MRSARQSRPQLVCVLADNSGSMRGEKAEAATRGIRELLVNCQLRGPRGRERGYYRFLLIPFGSAAEVHPLCDMTPVREIDPNAVEVTGDGGGTSITSALELAWGRIAPYMSELERHPERGDHPLPLILLYSDGHDGSNGSRSAAARIRSLSLDGEPPLIATAGVSSEGHVECDETLLRDLASSPACYAPIRSAVALTEFLAVVGTCGASSIVEFERSIGTVQSPPRLGLSMTLGLSEGSASFGPGDGENHGYGD